MPLANLGACALAVTNEAAQRLHSPLVNTLSVENPNGASAAVASHDVVVKFDVANAEAMLVSDGADCENGQWESYRNERSWELPSDQEGILTLSFKFRSPTGAESPCYPYVVRQDHTLPELSLDVPPWGHTVDPQFSSRYVLSGSCSENGRSIELEGDLKGSALCRDGSFSLPLELGYWGSGRFQLVLSHTDSAGNRAELPYYLDLLPWY